LPFSFRTIHDSCFLPNAPPLLPPECAAARRSSSASTNRDGAAPDSSAEPEALPVASPLRHGLHLGRRILRRGCSISRHRPVRRSRRHLPRRVSRSDSHRRQSGGAHCRWAHCRRPGRTRRTRRRRGGRQHAGTGRSSSRGGKGTAPWSTSSTSSTLGAARPRSSTYGPTVSEASLSSPPNPSAIAMLRFISLFC
jgi:hypothetical protein